MSFFRRNDATSVIVVFNKVCRRWYRLPSAKSSSRSTCVGGDVPLSSLSFLRPLLLSSSLFSVEFPAIQLRRRQRYLSSSSKSRQRRTAAFTACPFKTLNIPKDSTYADARKAFLRIAMKYHPDKLDVVSTSHDEKTIAKSRDIFVKCRLALESLVEDEHTGLCLHRRDVESASRLEDEYSNFMSDDEFDSWFAKETGHRNPFQFDLDPATMREVADMHANMAGSHGLDRDGGMWHLASMVANAVKSGKEGGAESLLRLSAGHVNDDDDVEAEGKLDYRRDKIGSAKIRRRKTSANKAPPPLARTGYR